MTEKLRRRFTELLHVGAYAAEVHIEIVYDDDWVRTMSADDAQKLEIVRLALSRDDVIEARKYAPVFQMTPLLTT